MNARRVLAPIALSAILAAPAAAAGSAWETFVGTNDGALGGGATLIRDSGLRLSLGAWQAQDGAEDGGYRISAGAAFTLPVGDGETWRAGPAVVYQRERGAEDGGGGAGLRVERGRVSVTAIYTVSEASLLDLALEHLPDYLRGGLADGAGGGAVAVTVGWRLRRPR